MIKDALIKTNPYLKDASQREKLILLAANSSTAVEGVHIIISPSNLHKEARKNSLKAFEKNA